MTNEVDELDVVIVGAGLSGIGAAARLKEALPHKSFAVLEARDAIGGTWDLFRYPGVRSDSDMFTLGYPFRPWTSERSIAAGSAIREYIRETSTVLGIDSHIRFRHRIVAAHWSSADARWTLDVDVGEERTRRQIRCRFVYLCSGYYSYDTAHTPVFAGRDSFHGRVVHPQWWPQDLDYDGKRVVVIGSGATAVTLVPVLAERAAHVTMLQRSPTYVVSIPMVDNLGKALRALLPASLAHRAIRMKNSAVALLFFQVCRRFPRFARRLLRRGVSAHLPADFPVDVHFKPKYAPWDQRVCFVPDADLFRALSSKKASVITDEVASFHEAGIRLKSGADIDADIIVTATGLKLLPFGGIRVDVDGRVVEPHDTLVYKGVMLSGVPNLAWCVGYTNASWTLRADLSSRFVCRLLRLLDRDGWDEVMPVAGAEIAQRTVFDLSAGYVERAAALLPRQGVQSPWLLRQNYFLDLLAMRFGRIRDRSLALRRLPR